MAPFIITSKIETVSFVPLNLNDFASNRVETLLHWVLPSISMSIADPQRAKVRLVRSSVISSSLNNPELRAALTELESGVMVQIAALVAKAQELGIADPALDPKAVAVYIEALSYGIVLMEFMEDPPTQDAVAELLFRGFTALLAK